MIARLKGIDNLAILGATAAVLAMTLLLEGCPKDKAQREWERAGPTERFREGLRDPGSAPKGRGFNTED